MTRDIERILVCEKLLTTDGLKPLQARDRLLDFRTARPNQVRIQAHSAKASTVLCRKRGSMSKYRRTVSSTMEAQKSSSRLTSRMPFMASYRNETGASPKLRTSTDNRTRSLSRTDRSKAF